MKHIIKFLPILFLFSLTNSLKSSDRIKHSEKTHNENAKSVWCLHQRTIHNGRTLSNHTTCFNISEKSLKLAINRLKRLYDSHKTAFIELNTKCTNPDQPIPQKEIQTLQKYHFVNKNGEIYNCYQKLVPLVFKITSINPPKTRFVEFDELIKTRVITNKKSK